MRLIISLKSKELSGMILCDLVEPHWRNSPRRLQMNCHPVWTNPRGALWLLECFEASGTPLIPHPLWFSMKSIRATCPVCAPTENWHTEHEHGRLKYSWIFWECRKKRVKVKSDLPFGSPRAVSTWSSRSLCHTNKPTVGFRKMINGVVVSLTFKN